MPETFLRRAAMPAPADDLFAWHERPAAFLRLLPPWESAEIARIEGRFGDGFRVAIRATIAGPVAATWVAELFDVRPGRQFRDRQLSGPFAEWTHTHGMIPDGPDASTLEDRVEYRLPLGFAGRLAGGMVRGRLNSMFGYRHAVTAMDLRRHAKTRGKPTLSVAVTGSTGLVGTDFCRFLAAGGHRVVRLTRSDGKPTHDGTESRRWNPETEVPPSLFDDLDAVVHLAGENVADGRWTAAKKARIRESRVGPTHRLAVAVAKSGRPKVLVSASAVGFYGDRGDEPLTEASPPGTGFLADVCKGWEGAADPARAAGIRVVHPRVGVVLTARGGALAKQLPAFRAGGGAVLGSGKQWVPWIGSEDMIGLLHYAVVTDSVRGPVNAAAPNPVTNREFGRVLAQVLRRPYLLTLPRPALRLLFGELVDAALLTSERVVPEAVMREGFAFEHPDLEGCLRFSLGR